jgi:hypothetical protein
MPRVTQATITRATHPWLRQIRVTYQPAYRHALLDTFWQGLKQAFEALGHEVQATPDDDTDVLLSSAPFGEPLSWRDAPMFTARRRWGLSHAPMSIALVPVSEPTLRAALARLERALAQEPPREGDFQYDGLTPLAWHVLVEQGQRGGPILSLLRVIQSQAKSIRAILVVGEETPEAAYHFDLVGAYPRSDGADPAAFYYDVAQRIVTAVSTFEVTQHQVMEPPIAREDWSRLAAPAAMRRAGLELGQRHFFTNMIRIADLISVPAVADSVARQYSEGCFATWEPEIEALIATVTGSARPVDKGRLSDNDLAVIVGVREDGLGAQVRHVEGLENLPPSSESVEMIEMDAPLPRLRLGASWGIGGLVPVVRSKLHGHRGVSAYDSTRVEFVPLDPPYYDYIVSCATHAQAVGIRAAFARAACLRNPDDPRQVAFTVLPGHGTMIVEKWVPGLRPFQAIWEHMDAGYLQVADRTPQGPMGYVRGPDGLMRLDVDLYAPIV